MCRHKALLEPGGGIGSWGKRQDSAAGAERFPMVAAKAGSGEQKRSVSPLATQTMAAEQCQPVLPFSPGL